MFVVSEAEAAEIRAVFQERGEFSAAVELRQLFPGIDNAQARECVRTIAGWRPLPKRLRRRNCDRKGQLTAPTLPGRDCVIGGLSVRSSFLLARK